VCHLGERTCGPSVYLTDSSAALGPAIEVNGHVLVPDYGEGTVRIIDLSQMATVVQAQLFDPQRRPGSFELLTRDGIAFFNDPDSERAGVIELDGTVRHIVKYTPATPKPTGTVSMPPTGQVTPSDSPTPTPSRPSRPGSPNTLGPPDTTSGSPKTNNRHGATPNPAIGLPAPTHISPANGAVLTDLPRNTTVTWNAVTGAAQYFVEVECLGCDVAGQWTPRANTTTSATNHSFTWPNDNKGRWRVTPIASDGTRGATSTFWQFGFYTGPVDLLAAAPDAAWRSAAGTLPYNESTEADSRGYVHRHDGVYGADCRLEDGSAPSYIETHPEFTPGGWIDGTYTLPGPISAGQHFRTSVGYIMCNSQPTQGIDDFSVWVIMPDGQSIRAYTTRQTGTDLQLTPIDVDLSRYAGATKIRLRVDDGPPNGQDWACWIAPRIER
jgi:hypothetical protein